MTGGGERLLAERLTPTINEFALAFAHEPADRVERVLETMRKGIAKDLAAIPGLKGEAIADEWSRCSRRALLRCLPFARVWRDGFHCMMNILRAIRNFVRAAWRLCRVRYLVVRRRP